MAGPANPAAPKGGFNKLFVMVPVMLAARKLDAEDPNTVQYLRIAYGSMQSICVFIVLYTFMKASSLSGKEASNIVFVPAPPTVRLCSVERSSDPCVFCALVECCSAPLVTPRTPTHFGPYTFLGDAFRSQQIQPFADPSAKKKYTRVEYGAHVVSTARSLLGSTLFGICMTVGLHIYKGMAMGLAIQTIMGPFNLYENPLVKAILMGGGFIPKDKIFEEKAREELADDDEVVDETGAEIPRQRLLQLEGVAKPQSTTDSFEELMLDTWDSGNRADIGAFVKAVTKKNCNYRANDTEWTPLMILSGLASSDETSKAIKAVIVLGGNPGITDAEGWNALHWAAFHGNAKTAKQLYEYDLGLLDVKDKEGKLPVEIARQEENKDVAKYLEEVSATAAASKKSVREDAGVRKRK